MGSIRAFARAKMFRQNLALGENAILLLVHFGTIMRVDLAEKVQNFSQFHFALLVAFRILCFRSTLLIDLYLIGKQLVMKRERVN